MLTFFLIFPPGSLFTSSCLDDDVTPETKKKYNKKINFWRTKVIMPSVLFLETSTH
jgi:hypothetical protein